MEAQSLLRKTVLAGIGVYSLTKEKAQDLISELVTKGELSQDDGPKFVKAMMDKADEEVEFLKKMVDARIQQAVSAIRPAYDEQFKALNKKIDKIAKEVTKLNSQ